MLERKCFQALKEKMEIGGQHGQEVNTFSTVIVAASISLEENWKPSPVSMR